MFYDDFIIHEAKREGRERPEIQELINERNKLISEYPNLKATQDEIDRLLSTTLDPKVRLEILFMLMAEKLTEMRGMFEEVARLANQALPE
jgi:predicted nuclease with TOPRIM domain